jgi:hypothetical protein
LIFDLPIMGVVLGCLGVAGGLLGAYVGCKDVWWRDENDRHANNKPRLTTVEKIMEVAYTSAAFSITGFLLPFFLFLFWM